jgi:hypothetical protein
VELNLARLFDDVYRDPGADEPRQVLADRLLELGDPRGEVIALQMKDPDDARARRLIRKHHVDWLGPLAQDHLPNEIWRRGFPAEIACVPPRKAIGDVRWNTVEAIGLYDTGGAQAIFGAPTVS